MQVICTKCSRELAVPNTALHKRVRCTLCGQIFIAELPQAEVLDDDDGDVEILGPAGPGLPPPPLPAVLNPPREEILEPDIVEEPPAPAPFGLEYERPRAKRSDALAELAERSRFVPKPKPKPGWCFHDAQGNKVGPLDGKGIVQAIQEGQVKPETILINNRSGKQLQAGKVPGLFKTGKKAGPLSPLKRPASEMISGGDEVMDVRPRRGASAEFVRKEAQPPALPPGKRPPPAEPPPEPPAEQAEDEFAQFRQENGQPAQPADDALAALARAAKGEEADQEQDKEP